MNELRCYETFSRGNVDEKEIVKIKIYTHTPIDEFTIKQINNMPCYQVQRMGKIKEWQVLRLDD